VEQFLAYCLKFLLWKTFLSTVKYIEASSCIPPATPLPIGLMLIGYIQLANWLVWVQVTNISPKFLVFWNKRFIKTLVPAIKGYEDLKASRHAWTSVVHRSTGVAGAQWQRMDPSVLTTAHERVFEKFWQQMSQVRERFFVWTRCTMLCVCLTIPTQKLLCLHIFRLSWATTTGRLLGPRLKRWCSTMWKSVAIAKTMNMWFAIKKFGRPYPNNLFSLCVKFPHWTNLLPPSRLRSLYGRLF